MREPNDNVSTRLLLVLCFVLPAAVGTASLLNTGQSVAHENRKVALRPQARLLWQEFSSFRKQLESYFGDAFVFRDAAIGLHSRMVWALGASPSDRILRGKEGWLFLNQDWEPESMRAARPFSEDELRRWVSFFRDTAAWAAHQNITFVAVIVPNKSTTYSEFLPDGVGRERETTRLSQLSEKMREAKEVTWLDLRQPLADAKVNAQQYWKLDSHWNGAGAYTGYLALLAQLQRTRPDLRPLNRDALLQEIELAPELGRMLGLRHALVEKGNRLSVPNPKARVLARTTLETDQAGRSPTTLINNGTDAPALVFYRDSFGTELLPLLGEHFSRVESQWRRQIDYDFVREVGAKVLVWEMVERYLYLPPPVPPLSPTEAPLDPVSANTCADLASAAMAFGGTHVAGAVDRMMVRGESISVSGWAIDALHLKPLRDLVLCWPGHSAKRVRPLLARPDVAKSFGQDAASRAGFTITIPFSEAAPGTCNDVSVFGRTEAGVTVRLPVWQLCKVDR